jgi:hypothetical protein
VAGDTRPKLYVREFFQLLDEPYGQVRETNSSNPRIRRSHNDIGADAAGTLRGIFDETVAKPNECQHQRDWNGNQQNAQKSADRALAQVCKNKLVDHGTENNKRKDYNTVALTLRIP